ncbi:MAG: hypothetical protein ABEJ25_06290 [Candidatus Bipolaricaulia bacterium]
MNTGEKQIERILVETRTVEEDGGLEDQTVEQLLELRLVVEYGEDNEVKEKEEIVLPEVHLVRSSEEEDRIVPYGPDRANTWKKAGEWLHQLVIEPHPVIREKTHENRLRAEESYFHGEEEPDYYEWQEDEETLAEIRSRYSQVKQELVNVLGKPTRSDFDNLYPHKYDDPGLSERARRSVRDLRAIFGQDIVVSS